MKLNKKLALAPIVAAMMAIASPSRADVTYSFNDTAVAAFGTGPFGSILLHDNGSGIDFTVTLRSDMNFVNTGSKTQFAFNAHGVLAGDISNITFNSVSGTVLGYTVITNAPDPNSAKFSLGIDCNAPSCANGAPGQTADPLKFTVANAEYSDFGFGTVLSSSYFYAADVICNTGGCNGATGPIYSASLVPTQTTVVPEPETYAMLLAGLGLMGFVARRRQQKLATA
jgi:hypothetical protein